MVVESSYSESSGSTEPVVDMGSLGTESANQEFKTPTTFPFQRLPMELQLLTLQHIRISPLPVLNPGVPLIHQIRLVEGEDRGQNQINASMIFTCKLYYKQEIPLLYGRNVFMYTGEWTVFEYTLSECSRYDCQKCAQSRLLSSTPARERPPGYLGHKNFALLNHAAYIHLRFFSLYDVEFVKDCVQTFKYRTRITEACWIRLQA